MSTAAIQTNLSPSWKQEVNRRLAEHQGRKGTAPMPLRAPAEAHHNASRRAQEAAARVAARYANAPSYNEILASEARAALRAAEAASDAALKAKAAAQSVLAGIEAASDAGLSAPVRPAAPIAAAPQPVQEAIFSAGVPGTAAAESPATSAAARVSHSVSVRFEPELPARPPQPARTYATRGQEPFVAGAEKGWKQAGAAVEAGGEETGEIAVVDPQPIYANLIEFPRELVATRKARPRLAEGPQAAPEAGMQLSIFEVDPGAIATEPAVEIPETSGRTFAAPQWSDMELDARPRIEEEQILDDPEPEAGVPPLEPVPFNRRMMALCVDFALVSGALIGAAMMEASKLQALPSLRTIGMGAALAVLAAGAFYHVLFFTLARSTPGMKYARIQLTTFDGLTPKRAQRWGRLLALLASVLPAGLGIAWSLFDEDHLCWHDRLSRTYLRRY